MNRVLETDQPSISRRILDAFRLDPILMLLLFMLAGFGFLILFSAGGSNTDLMIRQLTRLGIAVLLMVLIANISLRVLKKLSLVFYQIGRAHV